MPHHTAAAPSGAWFRPSVRDARSRATRTAAASVAAVRKPAVRPVAAPRRSWFERFDRWCWRVEQKRVEDYLARSVDIADLEQRMRSLERRAPPI
jgi:hypothetical protein